MKRKRDWPEIIFGIGFTAILMALLLYFALNPRGKEEAAIEDLPRFMILEDEHDSNGYFSTSIVVDNETNVMYLYVENFHNKAGLSPLLNADGTPMIYTP